MVRKKLFLKEKHMTLWTNDIFQVLVNHQVRQVAYVPDAGHTHLVAVTEKRTKEEMDKLLSLLKFQ